MSNCNQRAKIADTTQKIKKKRKEIEKMNFTRVVKVTTTGANTELLQAEAVKSAIEQCLGMDESTYQRRLTKSLENNAIFGFDIKLDIVSDVDTQFDINGQTQDLICGLAYSTDYAVSLYSIKMHAAGAVTLIMDIRG
jgi:hypothetical protein